METQIAKENTQLIEERKAVLAVRMNAREDLNDNDKQNMVIRAAQQGADLIELKSLCAHGEWLGWLKANCPRSVRNAQKYMQLANQYPELLNSNAPAPAYFKTIQHCFELINATDNVKNEIINRIDNGENVTINDIREAKKKDELLKELAASINDTFNKYKQSILITCKNIALMGNDLKHFQIGNELKLDGIKMTKEEAIFYIDIANQHPELLNEFFLMTDDNFEWLEKIAIDIGLLKNNEFTHAFKILANND
jgi:SepF-like predicted cell division protein (DUF552 family)